MKRLIRKEEQATPEVRNFVLRTTPVNPSFPGENSGQFQDSDYKSYSRMMNEHTIELQKERGEKDMINGFFPREVE